MILVEEAYDTIIYYRNRFPVDYYCPTSHVHSIKVLYKRGDNELMMLQEVAE